MIEYLTDMTIRHVFDVSNIPSSSTIGDLPLGLKFESGLKEMATQSNSWTLERDQFWRSFEEEKLWLTQAMSFDSVASRTSRPIADDIQLTIRRYTFLKTPKTVNKTKSRGLYEPYSFSP